MESPVEQIAQSQWYQQLIIASHARGRWFESSSLHQLKTLYFQCLAGFTGCLFCPSSLHFCWFLMVSVVEKVVEKSQIALFILSAASSMDLDVVCVYILAVRLISLCPIRYLATLIGTPASCRSVQ